jgi:hypothetical protein
MIIYCLSFIIFLLILGIFWFWYMIKNNPIMPFIKIDDVKFKTGDLILFHAYNNINPMIICTYWGHIGIVFIDPDVPDAKPLIFEAANTNGIKNCPEYNKNGIILADLHDRISKYPGMIAYKSLNTPLNENTIQDFKNLIVYAKENMFYNEKVIQNGIKKKSGEKLNNATNCGELTTISLIKLGLLPENLLNEKIGHHLMYVSNLKKVQNNFYHDPVEISISPF